MNRVLRLPHGTPLNKRSACRLASEWTNYATCIQIKMGAFLRVDISAQMRKT
jgi:hypothetical protein